MKKALPNFNQILLLSRQWDLQGIPQQTKAGFVFEAPGGKRLLHIAPLQETAFCFCLQKYLFQRGFAHGLRFIPNKYGDAYAIWEDFGIYLTDYFEAEGFVQEGEYNFAHMAGLLAEFHNAAEGLDIAGAPLERINSPVEYALWLTEQPPPPMTVHMLPAYEKLCTQAQKILEGCADRQMQELCEQALSKRQIIHGRFRVDAVSLSFGELLITDYSAASYGLPIWDLAYLLNQSGLYQGKEQGSIYKALAEYEKLRPLQKQERAMLKKLLRLPMEFIYAISDWQEQRLTAEQFAELMLREEKLLLLRKDEKAF